MISKISTPVEALIEDLRFRLASSALENGFAGRPRQPALSCACGLLTRSGNNAIDQRARDGPILRVRKSVGSVRDRPTGRLRADACRRHLTQKVTWGAAPLGRAFELRGCRRLDLMLWQDPVFGQECPELSDLVFLLRDRLVAI